MPKLLPKIHTRTLNAVIYQQLIDAGIRPILARIMAARPVPLHEKGALATLHCQLADMNSPFLMQDMQRAAERVLKAIAQNEVIGIETDHDCDGQTSHAVLILGLCEILHHPRDKIQSYIGHRMNEGYGLSESVVQRILSNPIRPSLLITADNGSADEPRIAMLKAVGIDVIVTDHHAIPSEGIPLSAYACLNPTREDCKFPDPYIAGCMVAWLLLAATRRLMIEAKLLKLTAPSMTELLDYVAVGTVADCVSMARSVNNRVAVQYGLNKINEMRRPCWQALKPLLRKPIVSAEDLGFIVGPLLNSDGRLSDAFGAVSFLLAETLQEAGPWAQALWQHNQTRKTIQRGITQGAMSSAELQVEAGKLSLAIFLEDGHAGVHGISASKIKDAFGRPTIIFSPKQLEPELISGSARSIDCVDIRQALQVIADGNPGLMIKFGGHKGAAGLTIRQADFEQFSAAFEQAVAKQIRPEQVGPIIWTDGPFEAVANLDLIEQINTLLPFGREFEAPIFEANCKVQSIRAVGQDGIHFQLTLLCDTQLLTAIWFNACEQGEHHLPVNVGDTVHTAFSLSENVFRDQRSVQCQIHYLQAIPG
ncbi:MAG: DHHA1 domain-containing protein [Gammaproteobacteria bacterium]|nr:DHHA1 domain-containing protein [Gammaproteobacteria bacterium]